MAISMNVLLLLCLTTKLSLILSQPTGNGTCLDNASCAQQGEVRQLRVSGERLEQELQQLNTQDCADPYKQGIELMECTPSDLHNSCNPYRYTAMDGGGWTKLLCRQDGSVDFKRDWASYKRGFGNVRGEYWLGNDNMAALTRQRLYMLRFRLWDFESQTRHADYSSFVVDPEWDEYRLHIGVYSGDAGDSFSFQNNQSFFTFDNDNDDASGNCASGESAGNWFLNCYRAGITHVYRSSPILSQAWKGIVWNAWHGKSYSLKTVDMKIRPIDFKNQ